MGFFWFVDFGETIELQEEGEVGRSSGDVDQLVANVRMFVEKYVETRTYIWQRDKFDVDAWKGRAKEGMRGAWVDGHHTREGDDALPCLWGSVAFDDNIDDEWYVVWILKQISLRFDVAIRVWDNDGEFLLIEAAYALPKWLKPNVSTNRVWIVGGMIHCIPVNDDAVLEPIGVEAALTLLKESSEVAKREGRGINQYINRRLDMYPDYAFQTMHRSRVVLPAKVIVTLMEMPQIISALIRAFAAASAKEKRQVVTSLARSPPEDVMDYVVTFNRCGFAQIKLSTFHAPTSWPGDCDNVGLKIAMGFELLFSNLAQYCQGSFSQGNIAKARIFVESLKNPDILKQQIEKIPDLSDEKGDDESWLYEATPHLEDEIEFREEEAKGEQQFNDIFEPNELSERMKSFVENAADLEGAQVPDDTVDFHPGRFLSELERILGSRHSQTQDAASVESEEGSSFYTGSTSVDGESREKMEGRVGMQWGAETETDSDDDEDGFMESYEEALAKELQETSLGKSFRSNEDIGPREVEGAELDPVELDINLVTNLLSSYEEQGAMPGPTSTLAAMLGVALPKNHSVSQEQKEKK